MDHASAGPKASGIPRLSRLPVMRGSVPFKTQNIGESQRPLSKREQKPGLAQEREHNRDQEVKPQTAGGKQPQELYENVATNFDGEIVATPTKSQTSRRKPRPSLSDRAMETLSQIPPTPSPSRRKSSFFQPESPMVSSSRPASSLSRSRPGTSHGQYQRSIAYSEIRPPSPTKRQFSLSGVNQTPQKTPIREYANSQISRSAAQPSSKQRGALGGTHSRIRLSTLQSDTQPDSDAKVTQELVFKPIRGSKTMGARPAFVRPPIKDAFDRPESRGLQNGADGQRRVSTASSAISRRPKSPIKPNRRIPSVTAAPVSPVPETSTPPKSSMALRETIARAKAARRDVMKVQGKEPSKGKVPVSGFPEIDIGGGDEDLLRKRISNARVDGRLNIAAMGLKDIPTEVMSMYNTSALDAGDGAWYESVDLVRVIAADNEIKSIDDRFFPDPSAHAGSSEDCRESIFAGLETLDLHGNILGTLPQGLRLLENLTTLNLSKNRLTDKSLNVLGSIGSLRELRVSDNKLTGNIEAVCNLPALEILDLSNNALTELPSSIDELSALHTLLASGNRLTTIPFRAITSLALRELGLSRNRLSGTLFHGDIERLESMKSLEVSYNALTCLTERDDFAMPSLQVLDVSENRIKSLPDMTSWEEMITLTAGGNQISSIPVGLTSLLYVKNLDFARNDLKKLDEKLGTMTNLTALRIVNNPFRERKFLTMSTDDIKRELRSRLHALDSSQTQGADLLESGVTTTDQHTTPTTQPLKPNKVLDLTKTDLSDLDPSSLESILSTTPIKSLLLDQNNLLAIPPSISLTSTTLTTLSLSHNKLSPTNYLPHPLHLPLLTSLNLTANALTTLIPLTTHLTAPTLSQITLARNRLPALPPLRPFFPALTTVIAADNLIAALDVEAVRGLHVLDVSGNEIGNLEPRLGLLEEEGLRVLVLEGNRFRVPRREVVGKGTAAVLAWLRGRIEGGEGGE